MKIEFSSLKVLLVIFFMAFSLIARSQINISGTIRDDKGLLLQGVSIVEKSTKHNTTSAPDGSFKISVTNVKSVLVFSYVGLITKEMVVGTQTYLNIQFSTALKAMDEVVVVGYATQKKANMVGAISVVKGEELVRSGNPSVANSLTGLVPGMVTIQQTGLPGSEDAKIYIRGLSSFTGNNQPLVIVDGFERGLNDINPNDVESISVLKDASATAVFGVKGGNGVILITTKRGQEGRMEITASYDQTFKRPTSKGIQEGSYKTLFARDNMFRNTNNYNKVLSANILEHYRTGDMPYIYYDVDSWDYAIKKFSVDRRAAVSARGGTKNAKYFVSLGYLHEGDLLKSQQTLYDPSYKYDRVNFRLNFDFNLSKTTKFSISSSGFVGSSSIGGREDQGDHAGVLNNMLTTPPYSTPYMYPASLLAQYPDTINTGISDRVAMSGNFAHNYKGTTKSTRDRLATDIDINQNLDGIIKGLSFKAAFSYNTNSSWSGGGYDYLGDHYLLSLIPGGHRWDRYRGSSIDNYAIVTPPTTSAQTRSGNPGFNYVYMGQFNYKRSFNKHNVNLLGLANRRISQSGAGFPHYEENWVGRATYDYDGRYLIEGSIGVSGSEQFAPGNRFGKFPSVGMGYVISKEKFMKKILPQVNFLKVRYNYGQSGNDNTGSQWLYLSQFSNWSSFNTGEPGSVLSNTTVREGSVPNINAQWERSTKQDLGIEVGLFNNAVTFQAEFYDDKRDGILMGRAAIASWFGQGLLPLNIGSTKRHGYELEAGYNHKSTDFSYWLKANYNFNENRVTGQDDPLLTPEYQKREGKPISTSYSTLNIGYYQDADEIANYSLRNNTLMTIGTDKVLDFSGDASKENDGVAMGYSNRPDRTFGFSAGLMYKKIDFNFLIQGVTDVNRYMGGAANPLWANNVGDSYIKVEGRDDVWTPNNRNAAYANWGAWNGTSKGITSAKYARLKTAELAYNFSGRFLKMMGLSSARLAFQGTNLFTYAPGWDTGDPENEPVSELGYQYNFQFYPLPKRYNVAFKINF